MKKYIFIWVAGLFTFVPVATYHLLFKAQSYQAPLLVLVLFWVFGFWTCFVPLYKMYRVREMYKTVSSQDDLAAFIKNSETKDVAINAIADHTGLPKAAAEKLYNATAHTVAVKDITAEAREELVASVKGTLSKDNVVSAISNKTHLPTGMAEKLYKAAANKMADDDRSDNKAA